VIGPFTFISCYVGLELCLLNNYPQMKQESFKEDFGKFLMFEIKEENIDVKSKIINEIEEHQNSSKTSKVAPFYL